MERAARMPSRAQAAVPARKVTGTAKPTGSDRRTPSVTPPPRHVPPPCPLLHAILIPTHVRMHPRFPRCLNLCCLTSVSVSVSDSTRASPVQTAGRADRQRRVGGIHIHTADRQREGSCLPVQLEPTESASPPWAAGTLLGYSAMVGSLLGFVSRPEKLTGADADVSVVLLSLCWDG